MTQIDYIKNLAKYGLENDQDKLISVINEVIEYSKNTKKLNLALQLQALVKNTGENSSNRFIKVGSPSYLRSFEDKEVEELILQKFAFLIQRLY